MGLEAFGVTMQFNEHGISEQLKDLLRNYVHVHLVNEQIVAGYEAITGEYNDGNHFIDLQMSRDITSNKCTLALRFSLCSYETIDTIFVDLVRVILSSLEAEVWLMTSALKYKSNYLPGDSQWLIAALPDEIAAMRKYWQNLFGTKQGAVRVKDSFSFVGVK